MKEQVEPSLGILKADLLLESESKYLTNSSYTPFKIGITDQVNNLD